MSDEYRPYTVQIELTNACNLDCVMCSRFRMKRPIAHMNPELFRRIVDELVELSWPLDWLHHMGEPLLWSHFDEVKYVFQRGLTPTVSTNCVALTESRARVLLESGCNSVLLCIDTAIELNYDLQQSRKIKQRIFQNLKE